MSTFIILTRNPSNKKLLVIVEDDQDTPAEFKSEGDANQAAEKIGVCRAWGYVALEVGGI